MQEHEMLAYLGDAAGDLTADKIARLHRESDAIDARYPHADEEDERREAFTAAIRYLVGDLDIRLAREELYAAREAARAAMARAQQIAVMNVDDGRLSEARAARLVDVDRMTLRKALGKR